MDTVFQVMFTIVVVANVIVVAILCRQVWLQYRHQRGEPTVINGSDALTAAAAFAGPMIITWLVVRGWTSSLGTDVLVYGAAVGIFSAALMAAARRAGADNRTVWLAMAGPMGFGVLAGLAGV